MSIRNTRAELLAALLVGGCAGVNSAAPNPAYLAVLDAAVTCQKSSGADCHAMDRVFDLRDSTKHATPLLVSLLDYHLGAASSETLAEFLTQAGKEAAPMLSERRDTPLACLPKYQELCQDSVTARNRQIDLILDAISKGVVLK